MVAVSLKKKSYEAALGVDAYPTVLVVTDGHARVVSEGLPDHDRLAAGLAAALTQGAST